MQTRLSKSNLKSKGRRKGLTILPSKEDLLEMWRSNNDKATGIGLKAHMDMEKQIKVNKEQW